MAGPCGPATRSCSLRGWGHVIRYGHNLPAVLELFAGRIAIVHLHGVKQGEDHQAIVHLEPADKHTLAQFLRHFTGSVSIEVFSPERLEQSLAAFPELMAHAVKAAT